MSKNLVSIIVPVFNVENYIQRCIDSLCNQTYKNLEIILVNDGSLDNSALLCETAAKRDNRIKVIHQKNSGSSIARNKGLEHATGEFITFVDSDDHMETNTIEEALQLLINHDLDTVEYERDDPSGKKNLDGSFVIETQEQAIIRIIKDSSFQVWKRIYKASLISNMKFIPGIIHQDVFFVVDLLNKVNKIGHLNKPLYKYNRENLSVIRSRYTLVKTQAGINATEYILQNLPSSEKVMDSLSTYVVSYYTGHFFSLCRNKELDHSRVIRQKLRGQIRKHATFKNTGQRSWIAILLPIPIVEVMVKLHMMLSGTKYYN